jgi:hypothetical protein
MGVLFIQVHALAEDKSPCEGCRQWADSKSDAEVRLGLR